MSFIIRGRKLYDALTKFDGELVSALFTTYNFSSSYFENQLLPDLLRVTADEEENSKSVTINMLDKLAHTKICVIGDGRVNKILKKGLYSYDFVPIFSSIQHSKIFVLQFEESFRLIVGSANLTEDGIHNNREVYLEFELNKDSLHWGLFNKVIDYLQGMSTANYGKFDDLLKQWRAQIVKLGVEKAKEDDAVKFLGVNPSAGTSLKLKSTLDSFLKKFDKNSVGERRVDEIHLLSPFWEEESKDFEKSLLFSEYQDLKGEHPLYPYLNLYFPVSGKNIITPFPQVTYTGVAKKLKDRVSVVENSQIVKLEKQELRRFPHGKLYYVTNKDSFGMAVIGSSNFSPSGFGRRGKGKSNWEANIAMFYDTAEKSIKNQLFPKANEIDPKRWQNEKYEFTKEEGSETENDIIVLVDAFMAKKTLKLTAIHDNPESFDFKVSGKILELEWKNKKAAITFEECTSISIEVLDKNGLLVQEMPIYFMDDSFDQLKIDVTRAEMIDWIESRYLIKKNRPLSMLLVDKISKKSGVKDQMQVDTDHFMMYRVKRFNSLVARIHERLAEISLHPKRVEYHLLGKLGLIHCIEDYLLKAHESKEFSMFYYYQAAEVVTAVITSFEGVTLEDSANAAAQFADTALSMLKNFKSDSSIKNQTDEYYKHITALQVQVSVKEVS